MKNSRKEKAIEQEESVTFTVDRKEICTINKGNKKERQDRERRDRKVLKSCIKKL